ncbi:hypothetical protein LOTGIDRAFT_159143 [Lottia gigantea]|uniref:Uncharacterized protein n=1 Tax=Lottia gigantea TaxID=225164 RepID=V4ATV9_LOTGI|nr:hypothetical protein LOTGIDRAFT_159143 [Lottia gigantea]ESO98340.1 hypothetical protein LOTGIDRAFT_159143 [Lottia gigantea]
MGTERKNFVESSGKVSDGYSIVNKYDVLTVEWSGSGLTEERIVLAFQALDELIPQLGIYSRILSKLRNDFFEAIYSDEMTGEAFRENGNLKEFIQRLPYFSLFQRKNIKQEEVLDGVKQQLEIVKERLFNKHATLEEKEKLIKEYEEELETIKSQVEDLNDTIFNKDEQIEKMLYERSTEQRLAKEKQHQLECDVTELQINLDDCKSEIKQLSAYKKGYDDLQNAFLDKEYAFRPSSKQTIPVESTRYSNLVSDIEAGQKLENQMLSVLNVAMEEYEKFLEEHETELEEKKIIEDMTDAELDLQNMEIDDADQELQLVQDRFKSTVNEMGTELELLKQHRAMLLEQLQKLEDSKTPQINEKSKTSTPANRQDSRLAAGLIEDEPEQPMDDPFIPQERVFSKYAAMLYTSNNNGKSYDEFKEAKYCSSCGEKTVICPHKLSGSEKIYILPINCSHLKITRPVVKINKEFARKFNKPITPAKSLTPVMNETFDDDDEDDDNDEEDMMSEDDVDTLSGTVGGGSRSELTPVLGGVELYMTHSAQLLFEDFAERTDIERVIPRKMSLEKTVSIIEQFLGYLVWQDEYGPDDFYFSILDILYQYMEERYLVSDIKFMATYDFLSSVIHYSSTSKMLQLFGHVLCGNLDAVCLRYILLLNDFIHSVDWQQVNDFRAFISVIYPFLGEDEVENLQMSYTSFSENHISCRHVTDFMIHLILKYREPRFLENENQLVAFQSQESNQLNEKEYKEAMDNLVPLCNEKLRERLYCEAEKAMAADGVDNAVSIMRLAHILLYC